MTETARNEIDEIREQALALDAREDATLRQLAGLNRAERGLRVYFGAMLALIGIGVALFPNFYSLAMLPLTLGALLALRGCDRRVVVATLLLALCGAVILIGRAFV